jgi:hypothetical protein
MRFGVSRDGSPMCIRDGMYCRRFASGFAPRRAAPRVWPPSPDTQAWPGGNGPFV